MNKRLLCCCLGVIVSIILTGCWDQRELSEISVATGIAIDEGENTPYKLTVEAINAAELSEQTASGNSPTVLFTIEGNTISELTHKLNIGFSRKVIYSHTKTVVISKEVGEKGMLEFLDFMERNREIRDDFHFIVAREGKAADILKVLYTLQKSSSLKLRAQLESAAEVWGADPRVRMSGFLKAIVSPGRQPVLAAVKIKGDADKGESVENMQKSRPDAMVVIDSLAIFRDETLLGFLQVEDTRNYLWLQDELRQTIVSVPCEEDWFFSIRVKNSETNYDSKIKNGKPNVQANIYLETYVSTNQCNKPLDSHDTYMEFENKAEDFISKSIVSTIKQVQKDYGVDIFGFGEVVARQNPAYFKKVEDDWDEVFQDMEVDVNISVNINRAGLNTKGPLQQ